MLLLAACAAIHPAPPPFPGAPAVLIEPAAGLAAGTAVEALPGPTTSTRRIRVAGHDYDVPSRIVALPLGDPQSADLDGDGHPDRAWLAATDAPSDDEVYPHELRQLVIADVDGRLLLSPERVGGGCSGESDDALQLVDATGDGRIDLVVLASSYICEAGGDSSTWEVLRVGASALDVAGVLTVPRYPSVGRVNVGQVTWWPGGAERIVIEPADDGALQRTVTRYKWVKGALVPEPATVGPVRATLAGADVVVVGANAGSDMAEVRDSTGARRVPLADLRFDDPFFPAELDGPTGPGVVGPP